jgi:tetratricopeptide (TPR) repeat protein
MQRRARFLLATLAIAGCTPAEPAADPTHAPQKQTLAPITVVAYTTDELLAELERGRSRLAVDDFAAAAAAFDRVAAGATDPALVSIALFQSGVAHEGLEQHQLALERYRRLLAEHADQPVSKNALVRVTRVLARLERWEDLEAAADGLLRIEELPVMDRIEGLGARGLALVERGQIDRARIAVSQAQELVEKNGFGRSGVLPLQLAQVAFADGEIRRLETEEVKLAPPPPNFADALEERCKRLLDAQAAYTETMRARDAHWSAMAGYRLGKLYQDLHRELMQIPPPRDVGFDKKQLFEAAMRLRYRILLEKGLRMMEGIDRLAERTGEHGGWIDRAAEAKRAIEQDLADEKAALALLPYKEEEVRAALELLKGKPPAKH